MDAVAGEALATEKHESENTQLPRMPTRNEESEPRVESARTEPENPWAPGEADVQRGVGAHRAKWASRAAASDAGDGDPRQQRAARPSANT